MNCACEGSDLRVERHLRETLGPAGQRRQGSFYTPLPLARAIVRAALQRWVPAADRPATVLDPAAGAGDFLLAARAELAERGLPARLFGADIDAAALAIAQARIAGVDLRCGDALDPALWADARFDLVIGNPPYGLKRTDGSAWGLASATVDSYAAFLAMGLERLAPGGVLAFVVADTWLTLQSHRALRERLLAHLEAIIRLPQGTFPATVGTAVVLARRSERASSDRGLIPGSLAARPGTSVRMADLTAAGVAGLPAEVESALARPACSTASVGIYDVTRSTFGAIASLPLFIGLPALADLLAGSPTVRGPVPEGLLHRDDGPRSQSLPPAVESNLLAPAGVPIRRIVRNGQEVRLVRLGDVAAVRHGISTGANDRYVRMLAGEANRYGPVDPAQLAPLERLAAVTDRERQHGLADDEPHFVPFDKGGASDAGRAWLPGYYVPTPYCLDWSRSALADMRRNPGFSWKNWQFFFHLGLTFSVSGAYAPTFRLSAGGVFEAKGSCLFTLLDRTFLLGILCSRLARYVFKVFLKHTVDTSGADVASFPLVLPTQEQAARIRHLVADIIRQQRLDPRYDYLRREQGLLDALVADCYGLSEDERAEMDAWFARRYHKLDAAIRAR